MKKIQKIYIVVISLTLLAFSACDLTKSLDDYEPLYSLPAETAISNESSAELALSGIYSGFTQRSLGSGIPEIFIVPDILAGYAQVSFYYSNSPENRGWIENQPIVVGAGTQLGMYTRMYDLVNRTNWFLENIAKLDADKFSNPVRQTEMVAEAKILRAMGHFYILRLFGQFYDVNSEYGIDIRTVPAKDIETFPRKTVAESYESILGDLDAGISGAPANRGKNYTNQTFAKAFKAKVLLYKGDYSGAATIAKEVINGAGGDFALAPNFSDIFGPRNSKMFWQNSEVLFGTSEDSDAQTGIGNFYDGFFASVSQNYQLAVSDSITIGKQEILFDNGRAAGMLIPNMQFGGFSCLKLRGRQDDFGMLYQMRLAEVYLILAEASARSSSSVSAEALEALNTLRTVRGATSAGAGGYETYPESINYEQFLTAVRMEKLVEIGIENGENWFDLVRYDFADGFGAGFQVSDVKAAATNPDKFILPIPYETIESGGFVLKQNPSYE